MFANLNKYVAATLMAAENGDEITIGFHRGGSQRVTGIVQVVESCVSHKLLMIERKSSAMYHTRHGYFWPEWDYTAGIQWPVVPVYVTDAPGGSGIVYPNDKEDSFSLRVFKLYHEAVLRVTESSRENDWKFHTRDGLAA